MDGFIALYIIILTAFCAYQLVSKAPSSLHAPLLSVSNLINGVVLIGAMIAMSHATTSTQTVLGFIAVALAAGNVVGGYMITKRILKAFTKDADFFSGDK